MPNDMSAWATAQRVLCVRLDAAGDVLMTTPAIRAVKETLPGRHVALLTSPAGAEAAALVPEVDEVIVYDAPWVKATAPRQDSRPESAMVEHLRGRFDAAVIFTVYSQNPLPAAFLCYMADIPLRLAHCHENPYQMLTDWIPDPEPSATVRHEVRRQLDLVGTVEMSTRDERLSLRVSAAARQEALERLRRLPLDLDRPWVAIHPGASAPSRRYPPQLFAEAARRMALEDGIQVVFTGSPEEVDLVEGIRTAMGAPSYSLAGQMGLAGLAAVVALAPVLVSNNTGPAHVAAAVGTSVVDLYALTNPQHTPWGVPSRVLFHDVPCKNCYRSVCPLGHNNCLRLVPPEAVVQAARDLLAGRESEQPVAAPVS